MEMAEPDANTDPGTHATAAADTDADADPDIRAEDGGTAIGETHAAPMLIALEKGALQPWRAHAIIATTTATDLEPAFRGAVNRQPP